TPIGAFAGTVALAASGLPAGATASFSTTAAAAGGSSTVPLDPRTASPGSYTVSIDATAGAHAHTATVGWTIVSAPGDTPPVAEITAPTSGATVSGTIAVAASATDPDGDA